MVCFACIPQRIRGPRYERAKSGVRISLRALEGRTKSTSFAFVDTILHLLYNGSMDYRKYAYTLSLTVVVEAMEVTDAEDALNDTFGVGEEPGGITITSMEVVDFEDVTDD